MAFASLAGGAGTSLSFVLLALCCLGLPLVEGNRFRSARGVRCCHAFVVATYVVLGVGFGAGFGEDCQGASA